MSSLSFKIPGSRFQVHYSLFAIRYSLFAVRYSPIDFPCFPTSDLRFPTSVLRPQSTIQFFPSIQFTILSVIGDVPGATIPTRRPFSSIMNF